jgi:hypothetical protein
LIGVERGDETAVSVSSVAGEESCLEIKSSKNWDGVDEDFFEVVVLGPDWGDGYGKLTESSKSSAKASLERFLILGGGCGMGTKSGGNWYGGSLNALNIDPEC